MPRTRVIHVDNMPSHQDAVYIGLAAPQRGLERSFWSNPFVIGLDGDRQNVIRQYRAYIRYRLDRYPDTTCRELRALVGKPLACWCRHDGEARTADNACHGDVLVELIEELRLEGEDPA